MATEVSSLTDRIYIPGRKGIDTKICDVSMYSLSWKQLIDILHENNITVRLIEASSEFSLRMEYLYMVPASILTELFKQICPQPSYSNHESLIYLSRLDIYEIEELRPMRYLLARNDIGNALVLYETMNYLLSHLPEGFGPYKVEVLNEWRNSIQTKFPLLQES